MHPGLLLAAAGPLHPAHPVYPFALLTLLGLATYRLTRLVVKDDFPPIRHLREGVGRWARVGADEDVYSIRLFRRREALYDLVTCHWCASGWIALVLVVAVDWLPPGRGGGSIPLPPVFWLAVWAVGAGLAHLEPEK